MSLRLVRLVLPFLVVTALTAGGSGLAASSELASSRAAAKCCTVTYNAARTHFQVTGVVAYRGTPLLFSFSAKSPCAARAGNGLAALKSRWIPVTEVKAGYHRITVLQRVGGKLVTTFSPKFFVAGKAQLAKPSARIHSGPSGSVQGTSFVFQFKYANTERVLCRLDRRPWSACSSGHVQYDNLRPGPHVFTVRTYALTGKRYTEVKRPFLVVAPLPG